MQQPLKKSIRDKFDDVELSDRQVDELTRRLQQGKVRDRSRWLRPAGAVAIVLLALAGMLTPQLYRSHQGQVLLESIALEVADNHLKLKPLEIESSDLRNVLDYFRDLDFQLLASPVIAGNPGDRLLGGRYCSIQGIDAAQLRVASAEGTLSTWYEATLPEDKLRLVPDLVEGDQPGAFVIRGVAIRIWQENGIVFAEARAANSD
ncbi:MAG: hypothetical protein ACR2QX_09030 [Woeseiaceae bacterium]